MIDSSGTRPATRRLPFPEGHKVEVVTDGPLIAGADDSGTLRGVSTADGRERWARPPARGTRLGRVAVADGWVCVVQQPRQKAGTTLVQGPARLLVLDAHSGEVLHSTPLPRLRSGMDSVGVDNHPQLLAQRPADGTVTVTWFGKGSAAWGPRARTAPGGLHDHSGEDGGTIDVNPIDNPAYDGLTEDQLHPTARRMSAAAVHRLRLRRAASPASAGGGARAEIGAGDAVPAQRKQTGPGPAAETALVGPADADPHRLRRWRP
ncbi:hypothetical protein OG399_45415 [Streptomyces achromogenes]